ncbi:ovostatin-like [Pyxicephalus adspersus]|uniref:ovostatin-like n=1 Tax=Pyxicephalus adspersus TaxID=30357 RepID=UPI003B59F541
MSSHLIEQEADFETLKECSQHFLGEGSGLVAIFADVGLDEYEADDDRDVTWEPQLTVNYNTKIVTGEDSSFSVIAQASSLEYFRGVAGVINVQISLSYNGGRNESEITLVSVEKMTGFQTDHGSARGVPEIETKTPVFLSVYAVSTNYNYTTRRSVVIASAGNVAFIRTDKELYKGGQEVRMYLISLDNNLHPVNEMFPVIHVLDPKGIRLHQWLNQSTNWGFLMLSFSLLDDSDLGIYQIVAERQSGGSIDKTISVEEYALPRFSVMMKAPNTITMQDKNVSFEMSVRYTYNQGVPGKISGRMCRPPTNYYVGNGCYKNPDGICVPFTGETDSEGTFKGSVDLSTFQLDRTGYQMRFTLQATVTEQGTNVQVTETKTISVTNQLGRVYFDYKVMLPYFKKGIPYPVGIIVENGLQQPESNQVVGLQVDGKIVANMTSDENGKAEYELDTSEFSTSSVQLNLVYKDQEQCFDGNWIVPTYSTDSRTIGRFYSATNSFIQLQGPKEELQCGKTYNIRVQYSFGKDALAEGETTIKFASMVISRSKIIESGEHAVDLSNSLQGEFNLTYETSVNHVPLVQYSVHYLLKDELVGDVINLDLEKCLKNKVSANFSLETGTPGSNVSLAVTATAQSMCLARVFDSSLQLLDQGQHFSAATIYNALKFNRLTGYYAEGLDVSPPQPPCIDGDKQILFDGLYWQPANFNQEQDVSKIYGAIGLHVITHTRFQQPQLCLQPTRFTPWLERPGGGFSLAVADGASTTRETTATGTIEIATVRKDFPELWYFGSLHLGETGSTQLDLEVPGTITEWKGDLVCLSNATGIGMTKYPANFTSFQKMFVDLAYPASIVRKETMLLVASVANYMNKCAKVRVSLQNSDNYVAVPVEQDPVKCVCSQERVSFSWKINATSLGVSNITVTAGLRSTQIL